MEAIDLTFGRISKKFAVKVVKIRLLVAMLNYRAGITHTTTYELVTIVEEDDADGGRRGSYVDTWYRTNQFHPFNEPDGESLAPPIVKGEQQTFELQLNEIENPLDICFHDTECFYYHGDDEIFCSAHTKSARDLSQDRVDEIVEAFLIRTIKSLEERLAKTEIPPEEISFEYSGITWDTVATLKRISWDIDV